MTEPRLAEFEKSRFDAYMALSDFRTKRRQERAQYEWRITFSLWAILIAAALYLHPRPPNCIIILVLVIITILYSFFLSETRKRNRLDVEMSFYYVEYAEKELFLSIEVRDRPDYKKAMAYSLQNLVGVIASQDIWWSGLKIFVTIALALCTFWFMGTFDPI